MWRAIWVLVPAILVGLACSEGSEQEPPLPTFSPSYWSLEVCRMPGPPRIGLLEPSIDVRFNPELADRFAESPQELAELRVDITIRNYSGVVAYLETLREPAIAASFHRTLVDGIRRVGDAIEAVREDILAADSIDVMEAIYAELEAIDAASVRDLEASAAALLSEAFDALAGRPNCLEELRIDEATSDS